MAGNIKIETAKKTKIAFNGNQSLKKDTPPKWYANSKKSFISRD